MPEIRVTILGCGDAFGSGGRFQTCFLVEAPAVRFLIDCGASSLIAMKRRGIDPAAIDLILLTHLHGDHFGGLPFLLLDQHFAGRERGLTVAGPPGVGARVREAMDVLFPGSSETKPRFALEFVELVEGSTGTVGPLRVTSRQVAHASGIVPFALRVECEGRVIAYSGDTEWTEVLPVIADGADLFICECSFYDRRVPSHLDYQTLVRRRSDLRCGRMVLTHMGEDVLRRVRDLEIEPAEDGKTIVL